MRTGTQAPRRLLEAALALLGLCVVWLNLSRPAMAHDGRPAVLILDREEVSSAAQVGEGALHSHDESRARGGSSSGQVTWRARLANGAGDSSQLQWAVAAPCSRVQDIVECPAVEHLEIRLHAARGDAELIVLLDADTQHAATLRLTAEHASGRPYLTPTSPQLVVWITHGGYHILGGLDHVAFVLGMVLLLGPTLRLLAAVTAFTIAHSVTLALTAIGLLALPSAPVEFCIALSVLLLAHEAASPATLGPSDPERDGANASQDRHRVAKIVTWSGAFGLLHGLGFAGALRELGLPARGQLVALLGFNLGVELGQILVLFIFCALGIAIGQLIQPTSRSSRDRSTLRQTSMELTTFAGRISIAAALHRATAVVLGAVASYWILERALAILTAPK